MKRIKGLLTFIVIAFVFSSCSKIENIDTSSFVQSSQAVSSVTLQIESPKPITTSADTTTEPPGDSSVTSSSTEETTTTKTDSSTTTNPPATTTTAATTTQPAQTTIIDKPDLTPTTYNPLNYSEQKGVWISYLEGVLSSPSKTESGFRAQISAVYDNVKVLGANTVYVHVRAFGDAYYPSEYYHWTSKFSGTMGIAPAYDPLKVMVEEAHKKGLSFHAWINPMRGPKVADISNVSTAFPIGQWYNDPTKIEKYIVNINGYYWLSPSYPDVRQLICNGVTEIVQNYDVDGIHIDDYFYPTTADSFDAEARSLYGGGQTKENFRLNAVSSMVSDIYSAVKRINSKVLFGVSPAGNINTNKYTYYADVEKWCSTTGYLDYVAPQLYYGFNNQAMPFEATAIKWNNIMKNQNAKLVIGLAPYKIGLVDTYAGTGSQEWVNDSNIISREITYSKTLSHYGGVAFYRYDSLFASNVSDKVKQEIESIKQVLN